MSLKDLLRLKKIGSGLRVTITDNTVTLYPVKRDLVEFGQLALVEKLNTFFDTIFFDESQTQALDSLALDKNRDISDANNENEKDQSVLEFICDLVFDFGEGDDVNITDTQLEFLCDELVCNDSRRFVDAVRTIAMQFLDNKVLEEMAERVVDVSSIDQQDGLSLLDKVQAILLQLGQGQVTAQNIHMLKYLEDYTSITDLSFPQLSPSEAEDYQLKVHNLKAFIMTFDGVLDNTEILDVVNRLIDEPEVLDYLLLNSHKMTLFQKLSPRGIAFILNLIFEFIPEEAQSDILVELFSMDVIVFSGVIYYFSDSLREHTLSQVFDSEDSHKVVVAIYKELYQHIDGNIQNDDLGPLAENFYKHFIALILNRGILEIDRLFHQFLAYGNPRKYIYSFAKIANNVDQKDVEIDQVIKLGGKYIDLYDETNNVGEPEN
jgi:hypothetical protein